MDAPAAAAGGANGPNDDDKRDRKPPFRTGFPPWGAIERIAYAQRDDKYLSALATLKIDPSEAATPPTPRFSVPNIEQPPLIATSSSVATRAKKRSDERPSPPPQQQHPILPRWKPTETKVKFRTRQSTFFLPPLPVALAAPPVPPLRIRAETTYRPSEQYKEQQYTPDEEAADGVSGPKFYQPKFPNVVDDVRASIAIVYPEIANRRRRRQQQQSAELEDGFFTEEADFCMTINSLDAGLKSLGQEQEELLSMQRLYGEMLKNKN